MSLKSWTIFCCGPVLRQSTDMGVVFDYEKSIAVNGAICAVNTQYWALTDPEVFQTVFNLMNEGQAKYHVENTCIWTHNNFKNAGVLGTGQWKPKTTESYEKMHKSLWDVDSWKMGPVEAGLPWRQCSMFTAIGLAILKGARSIIIYGANMDGYGYFRNGLENERTRHIQKRWDDERFWFKTIQEKASKVGIDIVRAIPKNQYYHEYV